MVTLDPFHHVANKIPSVKKNRCYQPAMRIFAQSLKFNCITLIN